jgi:aerobic-type carbon monoxide dehydrogenase small subunit (CoxS/CutS family)
MKLTVNGAVRELESAPLTSLLDALREELAITSPKAGCRQGGCGACTVLVDGEPRRACLLPLAAVDGAHVVTVEGLGSPEELSPVQQAFHDHYAAQCGYCTSGMVIAAHALLERDPSPDRPAIERALGAHVCRCTGYVKIVEAVESLGGAR